MRFWTAFCSDSRCEFLYLSSSLHHRNDKLRDNVGIRAVWTQYHPLKLSVHGITVAVIRFFIFRSFLGIYVVSASVHRMVLGHFGVNLFECCSAWRMILTCIINHGNIFLLFKWWRIGRNLIWIKSLSCGISFGSDFIKYIRVNFKIIIGIILLRSDTRKSIVFILVKFRGKKIVWISDTCFFASIDLRYFLYGS